MALKDRVGRSGYDFHWAYVTADIYERGTYGIPKNSQIPYLSGNITYQCIVYKVLKWQVVNENICEFPY